MQAQHLLLPIGFKTNCNEGNFYNLFLQLKGNTTFAASKSGEVAQMVRAQDS